MLKDPNEQVASSDRTARQMVGRLHMLLPSGSDSIQWCWRNVEDVGRVWPLDDTIFMVVSDMVFLTWQLSVPSYCGDLTEFDCTECENIITRQ